ncbi:uncharacterized protein LOC110721107 [Chenopodium quinoa]|uniref:uncharacterized protein LOC110721107 n=1 Tax=Chenopodium quinoa TaxID=63459 RepID=UPI000B77B2D8|nr:uncharacterized protein LOC110721107 [Chenopodium quinoa]
MGLFGLLETNVKVQKFGKVFENFGQDWSVITNHSFHKAGRIWIVWFPSMFTISSCIMDAQFIHVHVAHNALRKQFWLTMVYGLNTAREREALWQQIAQIAPPGDDPWILCGDFNNILNLEDRIASQCTLAEVEQFRHCLRSNNLTDFNGLMDHTPCCMRLDGKAGNVRKPFRFFNMRTGAIFLGIVKDAWDVPVQGTSTFRVVQKLKAIKQKMRLLNLSHFSCVEGKDIAAEKALCDIQKKLNSDLTNDELLKQEHETRLAYNEAHTGRYLFLKQKAKDGVLVTDPDKIAGSFISYYKGFLGTDAGKARQIHMSVIHEGPVLTEAQRANICRPFTKGDVKNVMNTTSLTLIPKVANVVTMTQFWPIACCNVIYKILSKLLCSRLKEVLHGIISEEQGAFVSGRAILDNIMLCQDLLKDYKYQRKPPRCTIKVDIRKAYVTIKWPFIERMLTALGFPSKFVNWIMACVSSPSFSLMINGGIHGLFKGARGIRQGDPLLPYCLWCAWNISLDF